MKRISFALLTILFLFTMAASGQSVSRTNQPAKTETLVPEGKTEAENDERVLAGRAIDALKRLQNDGLVYRSLGDLEDDGRLARASFETFQNKLEEVTSEVEPMLSRLRQSRLKSEITNALESYRDGAFWWRKIYEPRVVHVSALAACTTSRTPSDTAFRATIPYTVAIYWRQASRYLKRAEEMLLQKPGALATGCHAAVEHSTFMNLSYSQFLHA